MKIRNLRSVACRLVFSLIVCSFSQCLLAQAASGQTHPGYERVAVDSLDADGWSGIVFLPQAFGQKIPFGLRIGSQNGDTFVDGDQIYGRVREVGAHAPDGTYSRMAWKPPGSDTLITLEWSRIDQNTVVGKITAPSTFQLVIETYFPPYFVQSGGPISWDLDHNLQGFYSIDDSHQAILGERYFDGVFDSISRFLVTVDRPTIGSGTYPGIAQLRDNMKGSGRLISSIAPEPAVGAAGLEFETKDSSAHFVANLGWDKTTLSAQAKDLLVPGKIDAILTEKASTYAARRPSVKGLFEGAPEAIGNSMFWNSLYAPSTDLIFPSLSRSWASGWGGWVVGEWDCFFGALLTSFEDKAQSEAGIKAILLAQMNSGLVPNAAAASGITAGRSQPPVGSYLVWKVYQRFQNRELLEWAYPRLKKWHEWWMRNRGDGQPWRDGNRDGLLEWGSDRGSSTGPGGTGFMQGAKWESGMDDSPMYDEAAYDPKTYTMNLNDVGLNSLYALDAECLAEIAIILGRDDDAKACRADYERQKKLIQDKLWNEKDGIYENRFWNGDFSKRLSPTNFYPMFAGIATPEQAKRMVEEHLLNTNEFWGTYTTPTIARNDPAFTDQFYWRGDIWPPTNYMVYQGVSRYGFDKVALEYAQKSYNLFMDSWRGGQQDNEQYHADGGNGGGNTHYTWGALLPLTALEQYSDVNPWDGLRFGALSPASAGEFRGVIWQGSTYDIAIGPAKTVLTRDGKVRFEADAGVVVRQYKADPNHLSFKIKSDKPAHLLTREFESGTFRLALDGKPAGSIALQQGVGRLNIPAGEHLVELTK